MNEIKFNQTTFSLGRNGVMQTIGINICDTHSGTIEIRPITSKGFVGRCRIEIPKDQWYGEIIERILKREELLPLLQGLHPLLDNMIANKLKE